jgi:uncharacterized delta-60 repeat protein
MFRIASIFVAYLCSVVVFANAGKLDPTWASTATEPGTQEIDFSVLGSTYVASSSVVVQNDGKVLSVGTCSGNAGVFMYCVSRSNSDGTIDTSWNAPLGKIAVPVPSGSASAAAIQADGKLVVTGSCRGSTSTNGDFCTVRFLTDGTVDFDWGVDGLSVLGVGSNDDFPTSIAFTSDGKALIAGACGAFGAMDFCAVRFTTSGFADTSFGSGTGTVIKPLSTANDSAMGVLIRPDDGFYLTGNCQTPAFSSYVLCIASFTNSGSFDTSFGTGGKLVTTSIANERSGRSTRSNDGGILLVSVCGGNSFCVTKFSVNGTLDSTWGNAGVATKELISPPRTFFYFTPSAIVLDKRNRVLVGGHENMAGAAFNYIARFAFDGLPDTTFIPDTRARFFNGDQLLQSIAIDGVNKVMLGSGPTGLFNSTTLVTSRLVSDLSAFDVDGSSTDDANIDGIALLRLMAGFRGASLTAGLNIPTNATRKTGPEIENYVESLTTCTTDIDGDGASSFTIDGLILIRAMLGLSGNAAVGGINWPASSTATRRDWPSIRQYLFESCNLSVAQ